MRHPFDGLNQPNSLPAAADSIPGTSEEPREVTRRSVLGKMVFAAAGFVAAPAILRAQDPVTDALNEQGGGIATTLALGEEGAPVPTAALRETGAGATTTEPFGEEAGKVTSRPIRGLEDGAAPGPATQAANEAGGGPATRALREDGGTVTTQAIGEEGNGGITTKALGEEGNGPVTRARNEEGRFAAVVQVQPASTDLNPKQLEAAWKDLADTDSAKAVQACAVIYGAKQAVPFLKENLKVKFAPFDEQLVAKLVLDLDSDAFAVREKAEQQLTAMGPSAVPSLKKALTAAKSTEVRMRLERIIESSKDQAALRQAERGLEVLVALRTKEARELLTKWAEGDQKEWLPQAAKQALAKLPK